MSRLVLLLLLSQTAQLPMGEEHADGGVVLDAPVMAISVTAPGDVAPGVGCWLNEQSCLKVAQTLVADKKLLEAKPSGVSAWVVLLGGILLGGIGGYWLAGRLNQPKP